MTALTCAWCTSTRAVQFRPVGWQRIGNTWQRDELNLCGECWGESEREREWSVADQ